MSTNNNGSNTNGTTIYTIPLGGTIANTYTFYPINWIGAPIGIVEEPTATEKKKEFDCKCKKCQELYPYAEPNQDDGTLICYACRHGL